MQYRSISADGHVNEPPTLWTDRLPAKFKDRGPHIIETPKTKGHAWIMEGQKRPSADGLQLHVLALLQAVRPSVPHRQLQADQEPGCPLRGRVPRVVRPARPGRGDHGGRDRRRSHLQRGRDGVERDQAHARQGPRLACFKVYNDWMVEFQSLLRSGSVCNATLPTTGSTIASRSCDRCVDLGLRTVQLEAYPSGISATRLPRTTAFWAAGGRAGHRRQRPHHVLLPRRRPRRRRSMPRGLPRAAVGPRPWAST